MQTEAQGLGWAARVAGAAPPPAQSPCAGARQGGLENVRAAKAARAPGTQAGLAKGATSWGQPQTAGSMAARRRTATLGLGGAGAAPVGSLTHQAAPLLPSAPAWAAALLAGWVAGLLETWPRTTATAMAVLDGPAGRGTAVTLQPHVGACPEQRDPTAHLPTPKNRAVAAAVAHRPPCGLGHVAAVPRVAGGGGGT